MWGRMAKRGSLCNGTWQKEIQMLRLIRQKRKLKPFYKHKTKRMERLPLYPSWQLQTTLTAAISTVTTMTNFTCVQARLSSLHISNTQDSLACTSVTLKTSPGLITAGLNRTWATWQANALFFFFFLKNRNVLHPLHCASSLHEFLQEKPLPGCYRLLSIGFKFNASSKCSWLWANLWKS